MAYPDTMRKLGEYRERIAALRAEMRTLQAEVDPEEVEDYEFSTVDGPVRLSALFGDQGELIMIHNMGAGCPYCTLWADGFNGIVDHLEDRAAFVVSSPDAPEAQQKFAAGRGWRFRMVSHAGTSFADDMGYFVTGGATGGATADRPAGWQPGVSVFRKDGSQIVRVADTAFGPGDDFCGIWHLFDLFPEGPDGWGPKYAYAD
jgi:predicted dithiol-disulfide oxidoreductase (DUF899 family)